MRPPADTRLVAGVLLASITFLVLFFIGGPDAKNVSLAVLAATVIVCLMRLRADDSRTLAGSSSLVVLVIAAVYGAGLLGREGPVFGINPDLEDYAIVAAGVVSMLIGCLAVPLFFRPAVIERSFSPRSIVLQNDRVFAFIAVVSLALAATNYATGGIPILSGDVNGSRFTGNYGLFGRLWPLIIPALQALIIAATVRVIANKLSRLWISLGLLAFLFLIMSGGRSLFVIPVIAVALLIVDSLKPRIWAMLSVAGAGIFLVGALGYVRTLGSNGSQSNLAYLGMRDQDSWLGSLDISVQTGPRVFSAVRSGALDSFMGGSFFWADLQNFLNGHSLSSDRLVTLMLNRDPAVVGGLPPTLFGGLYIDWGVPGVVLGSLILGFLLELFRQRTVRRRSMSSIIWSYYFATYVLLSVYSYVSAKPTVIVIAIISLCCFSYDKEVLREDSNDIEVPDLSRWR